MVLAVMVGFLCYRVYKVLQPEEVVVSAPARKPLAELSPDAPRPSIPPRPPSAPDAENWASLFTRNPLVYVPGGVGSDTDDEDEFSIDLQVLRVRDVGGGTIKAQIKTSSSRKWYAEGQAFESYELLSIDVEEECCEIFAESLGRTITRCVK